MLAGVGDNNTLFTYDLLQSDSSNAGEPAAVAGGVLEMHALYGIGDTTDGRMNRWQEAKGDYAPTKLLDGSPEATERLQHIKAIRVGLILRTTLPDRPEPPEGQARDPKAVITATPPTLFADLPDLSYTYDWAGANAPADARLYRYRTLEVVLPLRNAILIETR
jgi:type IV pilus assembly protein PilW